MCDWPERCQLDSVCIVDVDPAGATVPRPNVDANGPMLNDDGSPSTYELAVGAQRFTYCVKHSGALGLTGTLNTGRLVAGTDGNALPVGHALAESYRWLLDG